MIVFYRNIDNKSYGVVTSLYESATGPKSIHDTSDFRQNGRINHAADAIVFSGMIRGEGLIYKWCIRHRKKFYYIDNGYIYGRTRTPGMPWYRFTRNGFLWNGYDSELSQDSSRWDEYFSAIKIATEFTHDPAGPILILPPSKASQFLFPASVHWLEATLSAIGPKTNREIIVREKPIQHTIGSDNRPIALMKTNHTVSYSQQLDTVSLVVSYNSAGTVEAVTRGIPVFCGPENCAYPVSQTFSNINTPQWIDPVRWLRQLVHYQISEDEIKDGSGWAKITNEG